MTSDRWLEKLRGPRPSDRYTWCDECCRWEHRNLRDRERLRPRGWARVLSRLARGVYLLSRPFQFFAFWIDRRAMRAFILDNRRRGALIEEPPPAPVLPELRYPNLEPAAHDGSSPEIDWAKVQDKIDPGALG